MGDVIDFGAARAAREGKRRVEAPAADRETELVYEPKPNSVGVSVVSDGTGLVRLTVTAPGVDVAGAIADAKAVLAANFGVSARDAAAMEQVRAAMGEVSYDAYVSSFVQQHFLGKALQRCGVMPFMDPELLDYETPVPERDFVFSVNVLERPSFELSSYEPVSAELPQKPEVTSKDVGTYLDNMANELATWENDPARTEVAEGDHVSLNLDATFEGRVFQPLTGRHVPYVVGTGAVGADFDQALVGMAPRSRAEVSVSVPAPADDGTVAYRVVQVKVQIDEIQRKVPAKIDDAWVAQNMPEAQTLLGLRSRVRTMLERQAEEAWRGESMARLADVLAERLVGEPDEVYVQRMRDELVNQFIADLQAHGIDYASYVSQPDFDADAWEANMHQEARALLRRNLALDALADHLDINVTEEDIVRVVSQMAPGQEEQMLQGMVNSGQMPKLCEAALRQRASEWLLQNMPAAHRGPSLVLGGSAPSKPRDPGDGPKLQLI
jgi:trigger factor